MTIWDEKGIVGVIDLLDTVARRGYLWRHQTLYTQWELRQTSLTALLLHHIGRRRLHFRELWRRIGSHHQRIATTAGIPELVDNTDMYVNQSHFEELSTSKRQSVFALFLSISVRTKVSIHFISKVTLDILWLPLLFITGTQRTSYSWRKLQMTGEWISQSHKRLNAKKGPLNSVFDKSEL